MCSTRLKWAAVLAAALASLAGCGGDAGDERASGDPAATRALVAAPGRTTAAKTSRYFSVSRTKPTGELAFEETGVLRLDGSRLGGTVTYDRYPGVPAGTELDMYKEGDRYFARDPDTSDWQRLPGGELTVGLGPADTVRYVAGIAEGAQRVGTTTHHGDSVTKYRAIVDLRRVAQKLPEQLGQEYLKRLRSVQAWRVPAEIWLDAAGRVRRVGYELPRRSPSAAGDVSLAFVIEFHDFGAPVPEPSAIAR